MKKLVVLSLLLCMSLTACGQEEVPQTQTPIVKDEPNVSIDSATSINIDSIEDDIISDIEDLETDVITDNKDASSYIGLTFDKLSNNLKNETFELLVAPDGCYYVTYSDDGKSAFKLTQESNAFIDEKDICGISLLHEDNMKCLEVESVITDRSKLKPISYYQSSNKNKTSLKDISACVGMSMKDFMDTYYYTDASVKVELKDTGYKVLTLMSVETPDEIKDIEIRVSLFADAIANNYGTFDAILIHPELFTIQSIEYVE